jgi:glycosyltransferase involved in cell wall biosynthesis
VGAIPHEEMPAYYSLAEVAVSVPRSDGLPQSLFEALACGTPSVLGRLAAYEEVVTDGESALSADFEPGAVAEPSTGCSCNHHCGPRSLRRDCSRSSGWGRSRRRRSAWKPSTSRRCRPFARTAASPWAHCWTRLGSCCEALAEPL